MSSFEPRKGSPVIGDIGFCEELNDTVELVDRIKTEFGYYDNIFWIAKDSSDRLVIVNERNLTDIGFYGE